MPRLRELLGHLSHSLHAPSEDDRHVLTTWIHADCEQDARAEHGRLATGARAFRDSLMSAEGLQANRVRQKELLRGGHV